MSQCPTIGIVTHPADNSSAKILNNIIISNHINIRLFCANGRCRNRACIIYHEIAILNSGYTPGITGQHIHRKLLPCCFASLVEQPCIQTLSMQFN